MVVTAKEFRDPYWINEKLGPRFILPTHHMGREQVREAIQLFSKDCLEIWVPCFVGWESYKGKYVYVHNGGAIGTDELIETDLARTALSGYEFPDKAEDETQIADAVGFSLKMLELARPEIGYALLAMVYRPVLGIVRPVTFSGALTGSTGTRKTSVGLSCQSHYGIGFSEAPPDSFDSTANSRERRASSVRGALYMTDDATPGNTNEREFDRMVRSVANRVTRTRLYSDGKTVNDSPQKSGHQKQMGYTAPERCPICPWSPRKTT